MAKLYFAKMNVNNKIYEVYANKNLLPRLQENIFLGISSKEQIYDNKGGRYKFFDLDKPNDTSLTITGNLGYIKAGVHSSYDSNSDDAIDITDKNKLEYITFYFDVQHEILAYMTLPVLSRKKVLSVFSELILKGTEKYEKDGIDVEFMPESNLNDLEKELQKFQHLSKVEVKLVPPNGDKEDFKALSSIDVTELQDANATEINQTFGNRSKKGLNKKSTLIKKIKKSIGLGFAKAHFFGKNSNNEKVDINTAENSPFTKNVSPDSTKRQSIIRQKGEAGIEQILRNNAEIRLEKSDVDDQQK